MQKVVILTGPTASGKTKLALEIAQKIPAVIINGDAMQLYREIPTLSAQPTREEQAQCPHALYGVLEIPDECTAARWAQMAVTEIRKAWEQGILPLIVGGSGLYHKTLMEGISPVPGMSEAARREARALITEIGNEAFHAKLAEVDAEIAARLKVGDTQRMLRAYEVWLSTGIRLSHWQKEKPVPYLPEAEYHCFALLPPREIIYDNINRRFPIMVEEGALDEVRALIEKNYSYSLTGMRAHGVRELASYLKGECTLEEAIEKSQQITRNYAKRQTTWINHQLPDAMRVDSAAQVVEKLRHT